MAETNFRGYPLPLHETQPPDVVAWLTSGLGAVDLDAEALEGLIDATNARFMYGPLSAKPASLPPGHFYMAYEG
jgi:hypothetical protein